MYEFVFLLALGAGTLSGIVGTGSSMLLLPVLVQSYGPKEAIPIMATAAIIGNLSRAGLWWRQIDWRATLGYSLLGVPGAALGAHTLLALPPRAIDVGLGIFFLSAVPMKRLAGRTEWKLSLSQLTACGGVIGFVTGLVLSTGPLSLPAFTAYGLSGGAFLGSEAASALLLYISKVGVFATQDALPVHAVIQGLLVGAGIMIGTVGSKQLVLKMQPRSFARLIDGTLIVSGIMLLRSAWHG